MFNNSSEDRGYIPGRVIPKTQKMVLNAALLNTEHFTVESRVKWSNAVNGVVAIEKGAFESPSTKVANFTYLI